MSPPTDEHMREVEDLSHVIIATLKELAHHQRPLTSSYLVQVLAGHNKTRELIARYKSNPSPDDAACKLDKPDHPVEGAAAFKEQLLEAYHQIVLALAEQASNWTAESVYPIISDLKQSLRDASDSDRSMEHVAALEALTSALRQRDEDRVEGDAQASIEELKKHFSEVLNAIQTSLEGKQVEGFERLQRDVQACRNWNQLIGVNVEFISYVGDVLRTVGEERNQIAEFMGEIGNNLIEIEDRFQSSVADTRQTYQDNFSFGHMLEGEVEGISKSIRSSRNLSELKTFVASRLSIVKEALEKKRSEDEQRMRDTDQRMGSLLKDLNRMKEEIQEVHEHTQTLERKVVLDPLTGIHNRRAYERRIQEELHRFQRYQQKFSLILFDVDHFKSVNDRFGHTAGDRCLQEIVKRVEPTLRKSDFMARYGGEEFIIILPGTDKRGGFETAERLRRLVEKTRFVYKGGHIPITISVGVTEAAPSDRSENLFERVDMAMYAAKKAGRNQSVIG